MSMTQEKMYMNVDGTTSIFRTTQIPFSTPSLSQSWDIGTIPK